MGHKQENSEIGQACDRGDPLSQMLFILSLELLQRLLEFADEKDIHIIHASLLPFGVSTKEMGSEKGR
jgi:hypothetical protein